MASASTTSAPGWRYERGAALDHDDEHLDDDGHDDGRLPRRPAGHPKESTRPPRWTDANRRRQFFDITVPLLRPGDLLRVDAGFIGTFQVFEPDYVMTYRAGRRKSTITLSYLIYQQGFSNFAMGYAAAIAIVLFAMIMAIFLIQRRIVGSNGLMASVEERAAAAPVAVKVTGSPRGARRIELECGSGAEVIATFVLIFVALLMLLPFAYAVADVVQDQTGGAAARLRQHVLAEGGDHRGLQDSAREANVTRWFFNSVIVALAWIVGRVIMCTLAG